jgi:hypothetical protein
MAHFSPFRSIKYAPPPWARRRRFFATQVLPNPYLAVLWNIKDLRRKKFGKRFFAASSGKASV